MPNKQAAKKALRQNKKHAAANKIRRDAFRETIKKTLKAVSPDEAIQLARAAQQALDKAAKRGIIKKNTAARKISRLMKKVHAMAKA